MMQMLQNVDPIQKLMQVWDQGINAAMPFKVSWRPKERHSVFGGCSLGGICPRDGTHHRDIDETGSAGCSGGHWRPPSRISSITMKPFIDMLLPAMIWMLKAIGNVIITVYNVIAFISTS